MADAGQKTCALDHADELQAYLNGVDKLLSGEPQIPLTPREWQAVIGRARELANQVREDLEDLG